MVATVSKRPSTVALLARGYTHYMQRGSAAYIHHDCDVDGASIEQDVLSRGQRIAVRLQECDHLTRSLPAASLN